MPRPADPTLVAKYAAAFGREEKLKTVGFSFLCDITGRVFKTKKISMKDMNGNTEAYMLWKNVAGVWGY